MLRLMPAPWMSYMDFLSCHKKQGEGGRPISLRGVVQHAHVRGQDGENFRDWPQPLGGFGKACIFPRPYGSFRNVFGNMLEISKSGLVFGLMDGPLENSGPDDGWDEAASDASGSLESGDEAASHASESLEGWRPGAERGRLHGRCGGRWA